jgi:hypothetical protein
MPRESGQDWPCILVFLTIVSSTWDVKNRLQIAHGLDLSTEAGRFITGSNLGHFSSSKWVPVVGCGAKLGRKVPLGSVVSPTVGGMLQSCQNTKELLPDQC